MVDRLLTWIITLIAIVGTSYIAIHLIIWMIQ